MVEPFCEAKIAHQRFAVSIKQNVSRLKIAVQVAVVMGVLDRARDFRHQPHTVVRLSAKRRRGGTEASARRVLHAEERQAILAFAHLIDRQNIGMIEAGGCLRFAPETRERFADST